MEYQVLAEFVRVLKISKNSRIEAPLLQYLSIMIQNMNSDHSICKMLNALLLQCLVTEDFGICNHVGKSVICLHQFVFFFFLMSFGYSYCLYLLVTF